MKATITVEMDNAAFDDAPGELARVLRELADTVVFCRASFDNPYDRKVTARDANGNQVAVLKVTGRRE
jgi:hypothetical protein